MGVRPHIIIIGAGFAGVNATKILSRATCSITLIDQTNHHLFQPLLYQVATAGLSPADISIPVRALTRHIRHARVILARVEAVDPIHSLVRLDDGKELSFDYLIVAAGSRHSYFGNEDWETLAPGLKTLEDAVELRRRILYAFEQAERTEDVKERRRLLTFVVIGAGPTGVEMAGAISELSRYALSRDFRSIDVASTRIVLMEAGPRVLQGFSDKLSGTALSYLKKMGIEVRLNQKVTGLADGAVLLGEEIFPCGAVVWAAGVQASYLGANLGPTDKAGRVAVNPDLSVPNYPNIFVCGDMAALSLPTGEFIPGQAPGAIQMGRHAARNIIKLMSGNPATPFRYIDKGNLATVGRIYAVGEVAGIRFRGVLARLVWIFVHIFYLISFRNRMLVLIQWSWSFFSFRRGARLITDDFFRLVARRKRRN